MQFSQAIYGLEDDLDQNIGMLTSHSRLETTTIDTATHDGNTSFQNEPDKTPCYANQPDNLLKIENDDRRSHLTKETEEVSDSKLHSQIKLEKVHHDPEPNGEYLSLSNSRSEECITLQHDNVTTNTNVNADDGKRDNVPPPSPCKTMNSEGYVNVPDISETFTVPEKPPQQTTETSSTNHLAEARQLPSYDDVVSVNDLYETYDGFECDANSNPVGNCSKTEIVRNDTDMGYINVNDKLEKLQHDATISKGNDRTTNNYVYQLDYINVPNKQGKERKTYTEKERSCEGLESKNNKTYLSVSENDMDMHIPMTCKYPEQINGYIPMFDCSPQEENEYVPVSNPDICGIRVHDMPYKNLYINERQSHQDGSVADNYSYSNLGTCVTLPIRSLSCDTIYSYVEPCIEPIRYKYKKVQKFSKVHRHLKSRNATRSETFSPADSKSHTYINAKWRRKEEEANDEGRKLEFDKQTAECPLKLNATEEKEFDNCATDGKNNFDIEQTNDYVNKPLYLPEGRKSKTKHSGIPVTKGLKDKLRDSATKVCLSVDHDYENMQSKIPLKLPAAGKPKLPAVLPKPNNVIFKSNLNAHSSNDRFGHTADSTTNNAVSRNLSIEIPAQIQ